MNQTPAAAPMGEIFETFVTSGKLDAKGREIGFTVGFRDNGVDFYAWVQASRRVGGISGEFSDFGPVQRSKKFGTMAAANSWAYGTARERIAKLK